MLAKIFMTLKSFLWVRPHNRDICATLKPDTFIAPVPLSARKHAQHTEDTFVAGAIC